MVNKIQVKITFDSKTTGYREWYSINNKFIKLLCYLFLNKKDKKDLDFKIETDNNFSEFKKYKVKNRKFEEGLFVDKDIIIDPKLTKFKDVNYKGKLIIYNIFRPSEKIEQIIE